MNDCTHKNKRIMHDYYICYISLTMLALKNMALQADLCGAPFAVCCTRPDSLVLAYTSNFRIEYLCIVYNDINGYLLSSIRGTLVIFCVIVYVGN